MIEVLSKPADQIDAGDIQALVDSEVPEGEQIEFKETLPAKKGTIDPWMRGEGKIGDRAKNELLEEEVAFANAYGGTLVLSVRESDAQPPVAAEITPVPRCAELAERLKLVFRDCVEPQIPRIETFAVKTEDDSGVVIFRVGRSRMAPHRVTTTRVCPVRRADRCEEMSMREIQDMTLNVSRGLERLERRLSERSERFAQEFGVLKTPNEAFGIRLTAMPVGDEIGFERVFRRQGLVEGLEESWRGVLRRTGRDQRQLIDATEGPRHWRPILRAARAELHPFRSSKGRERDSYREIHFDGLIEIGMLSSPVSFRGKEELYFQPSDLVVSFANVIAQAHRARSHAGVPAAEYAVEVEIRVIGRPATLVLQGNTASVVSSYRIGPGSTMFPRYSLGDVDEIPRLLTLLELDFWHHMSKDIEDEQGTLEIEDWPSEE